MSFPATFIQEIIYKNDIADIIGKYVTLKGSSARQSGLCPFHSEKTGSFTVFLDDPQHFYCFGCGAGGNVITFTMQIENLDYVEAIKLLAERSGIEMPENNHETDTYNRKEILYKMYKDAAKFYNNVLNGTDGTSALNYLQDRRLSSGTIKKFGLGSAPDQWDALLKHLKTIGYELPDISVSGLTTKTKNGNYIDYFRNRVVFPIFDLRGNVIAFGGRVMDKSQPKYLNSPDTPIYKKSNTLYNLNTAKNVANGVLILAEGYMDVIALCQAGFSNAIATLGTAITAEHSRLIARYAKSAIIAFDSDDAGKKASQKAISMLTSVGVDVKVLAIPNSKDPDEFIKTYGKDRFKLILDGSENHIEYRLATIKAEFDTDKSDERVKCVTQMCKVLATLTSPIEREVYIGKVSEELGLSKETVTQQVKKERKTAYNKNVKKEFDNISKLVISGSNASTRLIKAQEGILTIIYQHQDMYKMVSNEIKPENFESETYRKFFILISDAIEKRQSLEAIDLNQHFNGDQAGELIRIIYHSEVHSSPEKELKDYINVLLSNKDIININDVKNIDTVDLEQLIKNIKK